MTPFLAPEQNLIFAFAIQSDGLDWSDSGEAARLSSHRAQSWWRGKLSAELIEHIFTPAFGRAEGPLADATPLMLPSQRSAVSTDSLLVQPLFFPGGSIGDLAVNGTVNDLAMSGARPMFLTTGFILEEGLPIDQLMRIVKIWLKPRSAAVELARAMVRGPWFEGQMPGHSNRPGQRPGRYG